jgi:hypoxanthine phosphoribosyltransferase
MSVAADQRVGADLSWLDIQELTQQIADRVKADGVPDVVDQ